MLHWASYCIAAIYLHPQAGSRYSTETAPEWCLIPTGVCSQLYWSDFQYPASENSDHDMQTMADLNDNNIIFVAFNSVQGAFTYIITLNPIEVDALFSILLAAQCNGKPEGLKFKSWQ